MIHDDEIKSKKINSQNTFAELSCHPLTIRLWRQLGANLSLDSVESHIDAKTNHALACCYRLYASRPSLCDSAQELLAASRTSLCRSIASMIVALLLPQCHLRLFPLAQL